MKEEAHPRGADGTERVARQQEQVVIMDPDQISRIVDLGHLVCEEPAIKRCR